MPTLQVSRLSLTSYRSRESGDLVKVGGDLGLELQESAKWPTCLVDMALRL